MTLASYKRWMCLLASCGFLGLPASGCIATDKIEFVPTENFPPSVVSQVEAQFPLNRIGELNLDDPLPPGQPAELQLETIVRDPNIEDALDFRLFLDANDPQDFPISSGEIEPSGFVERPRGFAIPFESLPAGICHRIELVVVGEFASFVGDLRRPVIEGDFDEATWWVRVTDTDNPTIIEDCQ